MQKNLTDGKNQYTVIYEQIGDDVYADAGTFGPQFRFFVDQDMITTKEIDGKIYGSIKEYLCRLTDIYRKLDHDTNMQRVVLVNMGACRLLLDKTYDPDIIRAMLSNQ